MCALKNQILPLIAATLLLPGLASAKDGSADADLSAVADSMMTQAPVVKTVQEKGFIKANRLEFSIFGGGVTNDAFLRRWLGGVSATYHINELVSIEGAYSFSPDLGASDNRTLTEELQTEYAATPVISKLNQAGSLDLMFSPLYGKFAFLRQNIVNFDIYLAAGGGMTRTIDQSDFKCDGTRRDDALDTPGIEDDTLTTLELDALCETHFTTNYGFGFRGAFNEWMAIRVDGRSYIYIEHVAEQDSETQDPNERLEMKSNFVAQVGLSFFFPQSWK